MIKNNISYLDLLFVTFVLWWYPIYSSNIIYFSFSQIQDDTNKINYDLNLILFEAISLLIVFLYFKKKHMDLKLVYFFSKKHLILGVLFFIITALMMDCYIMTLDHISRKLNIIQMQQPDYEELKLNILLIVFSILNGFYEEFFFLVICSRVAKEYKLYVFIFSLMIRFLFHTYQGIDVALGISLILGCVYYMLFNYSKSKNLFPFCLSHSIADIIGLSILSNIFE